MIHVVVDVVPGGVGVASAKSVTILEAYNKLKHRFTVFDHVVLLADAVGKKGDAVIDATYPRDPAYAERLLTNTARVAKVAGEIAALVLRLNELGFI